MTQNSKGKMRWILLALVVLAIMSVACNGSGDDSVTPTPAPTAQPIVAGDGQVRDAIIEVNSAIKDTATEIKEAVEATGEGLEVAPQGTVILDAVWDIAKDIAEGE